MTALQADPGIRQRAATMEYLRSSIRRPGVHAALGVQALAGVIGASLPTALLARERGAGLGLGLSWGLTGATYAGLVTGPLLLAALAQRDGPDARALYLSGWSRPRQFGAGAVAAVGLFLLGAALGGGLGMLVGLGDSLRRGTTPFTGAELPHAPGWLLLALTLATAALLARGLSAPASVAVSLGGSAAFLAVLPLTWGSPLRPLLELWPLAPAWSATYDGVSARLQLATFPLGSALVVGGWLLVAGVLSVTGLRSRR